MIYDVGLYVLQSLCMTGIRKMEINKSFCTR